MSLQDMNWLVSSVLPTSAAPSISTVYLGEQMELLRLEQVGSSSSVDERRLDRPECEWLRLLEQRREGVRGGKGGGGERERSGTCDRTVQGGVGLLHVGV